jgi:hypothetical protein
MLDRSILQIILLNAYYLGVAIAFLIKEILWLRIVMVIAGICMIIQGILAENNIIIAWIALFTVINTVQIIRILRERRDIELDPEIAGFYQKVFFDMTKKEFQILWNKGERKQIGSKALLCKENEDLEAVILILSGQALVEKDGKIAAELNSGAFVAEMSYLTGLKPSADVRSINELEYIAWPYSKLKRLKEIYPDLHNKFQLVLSKDLTHKLKKYL